MFYIFNKNGEFIGTSDFSVNEADLATRGERAIESGQSFINPYFDGEQICDRGAKPSDYHQWSGGKWVLTNEAQQQYFLVKKAEKLTKINTTAQDFITNQARLNEVPDFEIQTWEQQRVEALAWSDDQAVETPILAAIAEARGIDLDTLRAAALRKAQAFSLLSAHIAGQRQALADRLNQATTVEEVEAIEVGFSKPVSAS